MTAHWADTLDWLRSTPLLGLVLTVGFYAVGRWVWRKTHSPLAQPVLIAIVLISAVLLLLRIDYDDYMTGASYIGFWLGPATVALAVPLHREWERVRVSLLPVLAGVLVGSTVSVLSGVWLTALAGGSAQIQLSMAPKAATTPVSIAIAAEIGGQPAMTAIFAIIAGITGAAIGPWILTLVRVRDPEARGLAMGAASHGVGTSRALTESSAEGAFSALSMGLSALATSVLVPLLVPLLIH